MERRARKGAERLIGSLACGQGHAVLTQRLHTRPRCTWQWTVLIFNEPQWQRATTVCSAIHSPSSLEAEEDP